MLEENPMGRVEGGGTQPAFPRARQNWTARPHYSGNGPAWRKEPSESMQPPERLLTPKEVAEILSVSRAWVLDHSSRRPHLPSVKLGKAVRFRRTDVEEFIRECARMKGAVA